MNSTTASPFGSQLRPELSLKRRGHSSIYTPLESDSTVPFESEEAGPHGQAALRAAWDKLYRARAILEAEQAHLRDDRIAIQGELDSLDAREQAVAAREEQLRQYEQQLALARQAAEDERESGSAIGRLTRAPFNIAKSVFGKKE
jgi:hypothetical protein